MNWIGQVYFYVLSAAALAGALGTIAAKNPIRGAMGLMVMILCIAGLFLGLHAEFLAAIQLIVYAGAIVVLFLFVIMLLGPSAVGTDDARGRGPRFLAASLFAVAAILAMVFSASSAKKSVLQSVNDEFGGVDAIGHVLFTDGVVPFELSSALLMVAVLGAIAVAKGKKGDDAARSMSMRSALTATGEKNG